MSERQTAELLDAFTGASSLRWKDEDLIDGQPVGPLVILYPDGRSFRELGWQTRKAAEDVARAFNLPLEVL